MSDPQDTENTEDTVRAPARCSAGKLVAPRARAPERDIPWELEALVLKAMADEPDERYQAVTALRSRRPVRRRSPGAACSARS